ncbi:MAG: BON domain-containing protein [Planctomycetaceae bacterium]|nr:MAG: BON domain-containing protein [Planctomycetaceae bacterium]
MLTSTVTLVSSGAARSLGTRPTGSNDCKPGVADSAAPNVAQLRGALQATGYRELGALDFELLQQQQQVVLRGRVGSYYLKQRATAALQQVRGVRSVLNELEVMRAS